LRICLFDPCGRSSNHSGKYCPGHAAQLYKGKELTILRADIPCAEVQEKRSKVPGYEGFHGTPGGYTNHKCRCDYCVIAWNSYCAGLKTKRREGAVKGEKRDIGEVAHGSVGGYQKGCKCDECRKAHNTYSLELKINSAFKNSDAGKALFVKCGGMCMCCGASKAVVVDHVHGTSLIRGFLCTKCNTGLGKLGDTIEGLLNAVRYLQENPGVDYKLDRVSSSLW
jgi:hypothetical protein